MKATSGDKVYEIPASKIQESLQQCFRSALNFWQGGKYAAEKGALHIAVGLWILALEEVGKHVLLQEAASQAGVDGMLRIRVRDFRNHELKAEKGQALFKGWGIDLGQVGIPLTIKTRTGLWFVTWDENKQTFRREFERLDPYPITKARDLEELIRLGLNMLQKMQQASPVVT